MTYLCDKIAQKSCHTVCVLKLYGKIACQIFTEKCTKKSTTKLHKFFLMSKLHRKFQQQNCMSKTDTIIAQKNFKIAEQDPTIKLHSKIVEQYCT